MDEADEVATDYARERASGHERKNHGGAAQAVVTTICRKALGFGDFGGRG